MRVEDLFISVRFREESCVARRSKDRRGPCPMLITMSFFFWGGVATSSRGASTASTFLPFVRGAAGRALSSGEDRVSLEVVDGRVALESRYSPASRARGVRWLSASACRLHGWGRVTTEPATHLHAHAASSPATAIACLLRSPINQSSRTLISAHPAQTPLPRGVSRLESPFSSDLAGLPDPRGSSRGHVTASRERADLRWRRGTRDLMRCNVSCDESGGKLRGSAEKGPLRRVAVKHDSSRGVAGGYGLRKNLERVPPHPPANELKTIEHAQRNVHRSSTDVVFTDWGIHKAVQRIDDRRQFRLDTKM